MKGRGILMVCLVLGALVGQSTAAVFELCYLGSFVTCVMTPTTSILTCAVQSLVDCIIPVPVPIPDPVPPSTDSPSFKDTYYFCKLGCAISSCAKISSKEDPGEQKVGSCVDSCSRTCGRAEKN